PVLEPGRRVDRARWPWMLVAALTVLSIALAFPATRYLLRSTDTRQVRFEIQTPPMPARLSGQFNIALSADGRKLAFVAYGSNDRGVLFIRPIDSVTPQVLPGTEGAIQPFWSPDSRHIGFMNGSKLFKIDVAGGLPQQICEMPSVQIATGEAAVRG